MTRWLDRASRFTTISKNCRPEQPQSIDPVVHQSAVLCEQILCGPNDTCNFDGRWAPMHTLGAGPLAYVR
jgi:hypothetical protein